MPARQDQTLQIVLIIFIFLFLVAAVAGYLGWRAASEANQRATTAQADAQTKQTQIQTQQAELENTRVITGFGGLDNFQNIEKTFKTDMAKFAPGMADPSYRKVLETTYAEQEKTASREAALKEQLSELTKKLMAVEAQSQAQIKQETEAREKAQSELAAESARFGEDRKKLETTQANLQKTLEQQRGDYEKTIASLTGEKDALNEELKEQRRAVANLIDQRKDEPGSFEVPDGRISWVNSNGTVWINLGEADALRRQVIFSVYDADQHDAAKATKKASIEVTQIKGAHLAEARITGEDPTNPVMTGDLIYSQVWHRGKKLRFALTGLIDFDGDGRSDAELARELIAVNGGIVDAYVAEDGKIEGEITANTRYLVLGEFPNLPTQGPQLDAWNKMNGRATSYGVEKIRMDQFLNQMGYRPQDRSVTLGSGATAVDFPAQPETAVDPASRFRSRQRSTRTVPERTRITPPGATARPTLPPAGAATPLP